MKNSFLWKWKFPSLSCLIFPFPLLSRTKMKNKLRAFITIYTCMKNLASATIHVRVCAMLRISVTQKDSMLCLLIAGASNFPSWKKEGMKTQTTFFQEFGVEIYCACLTPTQKLFSPVGQTKFICQMKLVNRHKLVLESFCGRMLKKRPNIWH